MIMIRQILVFLTMMLAFKVALAQFGPGPVPGGGGAVIASTYATSTRCVSGASPALCGSAAAGGVAVPTGVNPTLVVDTSAVTSGSQILLTPDETIGTALGVTCNTTVTTQAPLIVTARTAATSFTVQVDATVATNPVCLSYMIMN
jgi:hypothetical protein